MTMFPSRRPAVHRRSFLVAAASVIGAASFARRSQGATLDASRVAQGHPDIEKSSTDQRRLQAIDLKSIGPMRQVASIHLSDGRYLVTMVSGTAVSFPEFNLHLKIDSSARGPSNGKPVLLSAGMQNDRAYVVFSDPREISAFINEHPQRQTKS